MNLEIDYLWSHKCPKKWDQYTLIALVITIIVLLILAGVTIITLTGDNGLITKAGEAKQANENASLEEKIKLAYLEYELESKTNPDANLETITKNSLEKAFNESITTEKIGNSLKITFNDRNKEYKYLANGKIIEILAPTYIYGKLDNDGTMYLRATPEEGYNTVSTNRLDHLGAAENIKKVIIEEPIAPQNCYRMFYDLRNLEKIENMKYLHTENITNMEEIFNNLPSLKELDVSGFDTSQVTKRIVLANCPLVTELDVSGFDTSNANIIAITGFKSLKKLDISGFDTSNAISIAFGSNSSLTELDTSHLNTSNIEIMNNMFGGNNSLKQLNLSSFNTENVTSMYQVFGACNSLEELDLSNFDTSKVTRMDALFMNCKSLKKLNLSGKFNISSVNNFGNMFTNISKDIKITTTSEIATKIKELRSDFTDINFEIIT